MDWRLPHRGFDSEGLATESSGPVCCEFRRPADDLGQETESESESAAKLVPAIEKRVHPRWKRTLDLVGVVVVFPLLSPMLVLVALYIKLVSPGPVLFVQSRVGYGGDLFRIVKFRTMHVPSASRDEAHRDYVASRASVGQPIQKPEHLKSELIPGGSLLRKWSIDEFPQLVNVINGSMSLVGPRPDVLRIDDYEPWQLRRFEVLPGMTGLWQVSGKNRLTHDQMVALDIKYIETRSLRRDLGILAKTVRVVLLGDGE